MSIKAFWILFNISFFFLFTLTSCETNTNIKKFHDPETNLYGYKLDQKTIINPQFTFAYEFTPEGLATVMDQGGSWIRINKNKQVVEKPYLVNGVPDTYVEGLARFVSHDLKIGFSDQFGNPIIAPKYDWASRFKDGRSLVCQGCEEELNDITGETKIVGGLWGVISSTGEVIEQINLTKEQLVAKVSDK